MRRKTGIILILIANIIMMAHHLIPHHEPSFTNSYECLIAYHTIKQSSKCPNNHTHNFNKSNNSHNQLLDIDDCSLEEIHIRYNEHNQITENDIADISSLLLFQNDILSTSEPMEEINTEVLKPYLLPKYNTNYVRIIGLRAPPHC